MELSICSTSADGLSNYFETFRKAFHPILFGFFSLNRGPVQLSSVTKAEPSVLIHLIHLRRVLENSLGSIRPGVLRPSRPNLTPWVSGSRGHGPGAPLGARLKRPVSSPGTSHESVESVKRTEFMFWRETWWPFFYVFFGVNMGSSVLSEMFFALKFDGNARH